MESDIHISFWGVLVALGSFHGIFLAIGLFSKDENRAANALFAFLLLVVSYNLFEYTIAISRLYDKFPHLIATSYPFLFLMGPFYFFYVKKLTVKDFIIQKKQLLHLLPAVICLLLLTPFYLTTPESKMDFLKTEVGGSEDHIEIPWGQYLFMASHFIQTFIYLLFSKRLLNKQETAYKANLSDNSLINFSILRQMTSVFFWFLVGCLLVLALLPVIKQYRVEMDYVLVLTLSVLIHTTGYIALKQPLFFGYLLEPEDKEKYASYKLTEAQSEELYKKIVDKIEHEQLYLISDYKIADLATALEVPIHYLSQVINETTDKNFFEFINSFRVNKARKLLAENGNSYLKIMTVAFDSGFNNKSTFNRIFKKHTGFTPSQYKEKFL
ncbi:MAG: helix-turn-helix domain-containing protein [Reichenbachiella sp.]|uniref:helix-turn-helix domain-containing protein n=1 Tax=Reichenbachiella sp. TaxID=2184521 RepID=UPI003264558F